MFVCVFVAGCIKMLQDTQKRYLEGASSFICFCVPKEITDKKGHWILLVLSL